MSDPTSSPTSGPTSGSSRPGRTQDTAASGRPPSGVAPGRGPGGAPQGPVGRTRGVAGLGGALAISVVATVVIALLNGLLAVAAGLLAVTGVAAWLVGQALRAGDGTAAGGGPLATPAGRTGAAVALAIVVVIAGALGSWLLSLPQGGVLGPLDYLGQAFGLLLPAMAAIAAASAWLGTR